MVRYSISRTGPCVTATLGKHCDLQLQIFFCFFYFFLNSRPSIFVASCCLLGRCYVLSARPGHQQLQSALFIYLVIFPAKPHE